MLRKFPGQSGGRTTHNNNKPSEKKTREKKTRKQNKFPSRN